MKRFVKIIFVVVIAAGVALGIYKFVKARGEAAAPPAEDEAVPTVVTVQTGELKLATLHRYVTGYGMVEPASATAEQPAASAQLAAPSAGVVAKVSVVEGQHVEKGDAVVELDSGTTTATFAEQEVERQKKLYAQQNTSLRNLQNAEAQLALLRVVAPLSGTVTRVNVKPGAAVDPTTIVAEVMDLNRLAVRADIPASQAGDVKAGEELQTLTEPPATATLAFVSPAVDANTGTVSVWAALPADSGLRPGQFVPLQIVTAIHTNCLAAPEESVVTDESGKGVIALVHDDEAAQTPVQIGFRENGWVEIEGAGLKAGDKVVTVGAYGLPDKTKIQIANSSESPGGTAATNSPDAQ
jgi:membrane fusion protein, multidrug efflux system